MSTGWTPEDQLELVGRLEARSGADSAALFGAWNLGDAYNGAGRYSSKRAKIAAGLDAARARHILGNVLDSIAALVGMRPGEKANIEETRVTAEKIFISHASADKGLAGLLQRAMILGGVPADSIFYSSDRLTGIPAGRDVAEYLRKSLREAGLVIELLTPTFLTRPRCLMELGGAWVAETPTFPIVVPPLTTPAARDAIGDVHLIVVSPDSSNFDVFSELQDRIKEGLGIDLSARQWRVASDEFDKNLTATIRESTQELPRRADNLGSGDTAQIPEQDDDAEFTFSRVVVRDGTMYGEATNRDSRKRSAILTVTFYNEAGEIVGSNQVAVSEVRPGLSRTFTVYDVPEHAQQRIEVSTLI